MKTPTTITALTVAPLDIPLLSPFGIAGGAQEVARNLLVTIELADGTCGYGEAAPLPPFNGETQASSMAALEAVRSALEGADVREWRPIAALLRAQIPAAGSARCALETAILDALTKRVQLPLYVFFGGAGQRLETDMTITTGSVAEAQQAAQAIRARGIQTLKVKLGSGTLELDLQRIVAIHAVAPTAPLILDGNGGMCATTTLELLEQLAAREITPVLLEQPVPGDDWAGMQRLAQHGTVPVAADESASSSTNVLRLAREGAAHVINIKLMKAGVVEALDIAAIARAAGLRLMIGGMVEALLAMTMSAHVAAGLGGFEFVDLDTPMFLAENPFAGGFQQNGPHLDLSHITGGHGVIPL
ncbi:dipeptide epimerase [Candidatus Viridilinea mediisalina]|uniref:Dipeptide epimerase n=1 Tax=Candidatus Viridilinea mediisalina TaxID=2024553 RepID=A0A2A6RDQ7_9CHLR|nr:dipeptide epimerase [Candidatus Viridilinea mediisalina]PDV99946.1 dipeptide epimerase [Candidatus Viridilinea mediisalina]